MKKLQQIRKKIVCITIVLFVCFTACESSQRRMDLWCRNELFHNNASHARCSGDVRARFDRGRTLSWKLWRCYYESALKSNFSGYDDKLKSTCYETRHMQLKRLSKRCKNFNFFKLKNVIYQLSELIDFYFYPFLYIFFSKIIMEILIK